MNTPLEAFGFLGFFVFNNRAVSINAMDMVELLTFSSQAFTFKITLRTGEVITIDGEEAHAFAEQLRSIVRQAQFGAGPMSIKKG